MDPVPESVLHEIVERVVRQTLGGTFKASEPSQPSQPKSTLIRTSLPEATQPGLEKKVVAIGTDHGGVDLKNTLVKLLNENNYAVIDCGTHSSEAVDYPDIALSVAQLVAQGKSWRGIIIDGAGIGSCMAANKVPGIRAAMCYDHATAVNSREHNDANVLTLGAGLIGANLAKQILITWLNTEFGGGRHAKRVEKIIAIEKSYARDGKA